VPGIVAFINLCWQTKTRTGKHKGVPENTNARQQVGWGFTFLVNYQLNRFRQSQRRVKNLQKNCGSISLFKKATIPGTHMSLAIQEFRKTKKNLTEK
jgi:hypothetical protein